MSRLDALQAQYGLAREYAGDKPILFVVYGGGLAVKQLVPALPGAIHIVEQREQVKVPAGS